MVAHLKLMIAKLRRDQFGQSSERGRRLLDQLELQLEELEANAVEDECATDAAAAAAALPASVVKAFTRRKPVRAPLPADLPRERVVIPGSTECPCCGGKLAKLGEDVTETLEVVPRRWKVMQTVREKRSCRACEKIAQAPAPFHPIMRGRAARQPAGDGPLCQVRQPSALEPSECKTACGRPRRPLDLPAPAAGTPTPRTR
jgi:transposase